jgi:hypothetical protein
MEADRDSQAGEAVADRQDSQVDPLDRSAPQQHHRRHEGREGKDDRDDVRHLVSHPV